MSMVKRGKMGAMGRRLLKVSAKILQSAVMGMRPDGRIRIVSARPFPRASSLWSVDP